MPIIISQDKNRIVDTNNLYINKNAIFAKPFEGKGVLLGVYDTQERCKQLMAEIEAKINGKTEVLNVYEDMNDSYIAAARLSQKVYPMPEK